MVGQIEIVDFEEGQLSIGTDCIVCIVVVEAACCTRQASFRTVKFTGRKDACLGGRGGNCGANSEKIIDFEERNGRLHGTTEGLLVLEF